MKLDFKGIMTNIALRWEQGIEHHPDALELMLYLKLINTKYNNDADFDFLETGGDGDAGEDLLFLLDVYFDAKDQECFRPITRSEG